MTMFRVSLYEFRLKPLALLVTLLAIALMIKLGFWQLSRGAEKQLLVDQHAATTVQGAQPFYAGAINDLANQPSRIVAWQGKLHTQHYFLIENKMYEGQVGYEVVALASIPSSPNVENNSYVPVNLGWVPAAAERAQLPEVIIPSQPVYLEGQIYLPEPPFLLSAQHPNQQWPIRLQYPEIDVMARVSGYAFSPFIVRLNMNADIGYVRDWPVVIMKPEKHYAYAVQWFGLAFAAAVVFIVASLKRKKPKNNNKIKDIT